MAWIDCICHDISSTMAWKFQDCTRTVFTEREQTFTRRAEKTQQAFNNSCEQRTRTQQAANSEREHNRLWTYMHHSFQNSIKCEHRCEHNSPANSEREHIIVRTSREQRTSRSLRTRTYLGSNTTANIEQRFSNIEHRSRTVLLCSFRTITFRSSRHQSWHARMRVRRV